MYFKNILGKRFIYCKLDEDHFARSQMNLSIAYLLYGPFMVKSIVTFLLTASIIAASSAAIASLTKCNYHI